MNIIILYGLKKIVMTFFMQGTLKYHCCNKLTENKHTLRIYDIVKKIKSYLNSLHNMKTFTSN